MKKTATLLTLFTLTSLLGGCVSRTTSLEPQNRGADTSTKKSKKYGSTEPQGEVIDKKVVWIWQKEFRESR
jgi:hypothetical protein